MEDHVILGVHLTDRVKEAQSVQKVLTAQGAHIKTRLGLHEVGTGTGAAGLILLEVTGGSAIAKSIGAELKSIEGIEVQEMVFSHD